MTALNNMKHAAAQLLLLATAVSAGFLPTFDFFATHGPLVPQFYHVYPNPVVATPVVDQGRSSATLPCPSEGFFAHPTNCSRFYRCVDYAGTGQYFSPYEFQCPAGQVFLAVGKNTCVPGNCPGSSGLVSQVPPSGYDPHQQIFMDVPTPAGAVIPIDGTVAVPVGGGSAVVPVGGAYPQPGQVGAQPGQVGQIGGPVSAAGAQTGLYPQPGGSSPSVGTVPVGSFPPAGSAYPQPSGSSPPVGTVPVGSFPPAGSTYPQPGSAGAIGSPEGGPSNTDPVPVTVGVVQPQPGAGEGAYPPPGAAGATGTTSVGPGATYPPPGGDGGAAAGGSGDATEGSGAAAGGGAYPGAAAGGACPARYVQSATYCNVYEPCPKEGIQYVCVTLNGQELVFDQARQMCTYRDQVDVCNGKAMLPSLFRSTLNVFDQQPTLQELSVPIAINNQDLPVFYTAREFQPFFSEQVFPSFSPGQAFPTFDQNFNVQAVGSPNHGTAFIAGPSAFFRR